MGDKRKAIGVGQKRKVELARRPQKDEFGEIGERASGE